LYKTVTIRAKKICQQFILQAKTLSLATGTIAYGQSSVSILQMTKIREKFITPSVDVITANSIIITR